MGLRNITGEFGWLDSLYIAYYFKRIQNYPNIIIFGMIFKIGVRDK